MTARVPDNNLVADPHAAKVGFSGQVENRWLSTLLGWVARALIFVAIWGQHRTYRHTRVPWGAALMVLDYLTRIRTGIAGTVQIPSHRPLIYLKFF